MVLVCMLKDPTVCHTLLDTQGPYTKEEQCVRRAYEIAVELPEHMPEYIATKYKCVKKNSPKGEVKINYGRDKEKETQKHWNEGSYHQRWAQKTY